MVANTVEVTVTRLRIRLLKVVFDGGYQLVVGGRLLLESRDGRKTTHPDLPEYEPGMFPADFMAWSYGEVGGISVQMVSDSGKTMRDIDSVRACTLLFKPHDADSVRQWLRSRR